MTSHLIPIGIVERETGISKDVLRKWELRYGFPLPVRNGNGERHYSAEQLDRLRTIKRLMDSGMRPARAVTMDAANLGSFAGNIRANLPPTDDDGLIPRAIAALASDHLTSLRQLLVREIAQRGIQKCVVDVIAPLTTAVGDAWSQGTISVHQEHLYAEVVHTLLHNIIANLPAADGPCILLATPPNESHTLGLAMLLTLLNLHGAQGISLGAQVPVAELAQAAKAQRADIVALSFSVAFPARGVSPLLADLRQRLPAEVAIWAGGAGAARHKRLPPGILRLVTLTEGLEALQSRGITP